jgi:hypothetical protein
MQFYFGPKNITSTTHRSCVTSSSDGGTTGLIL